MAITFTLPHNTRIIGIGTNSFDRSGLEKYLPNYTIISLDTAVTSDLENRKVEEWLQTQEGRQAITNLQKKGERLLCLVYKSTPVLERIAKELGISLLANLSALQERFENKLQFRSLFAGKIPLAEFIVKETADLNQEEHTSLIKQFSSYVIQDETLSGGKGTFHVATTEEYVRARETLVKAHSKHVAISRYIPGYDVSVQACITKHGIFMAGLQEPIIGDPYLVNTLIPGSNQFCGGQWSPNAYPSAIQDQAQQTTMVIAQTMKEAGYRGIFGIDFRLDENNTLYTIEVNARLTGFTPLLTMLQEANTVPPLVLLHILELADIEYALTDQTSIQYQVGNFTPLSYALIHNRRTSAVKLRDPFQSGLYHVGRTGFLTWVHKGDHLKDIPDDEHILLIDLPTVSRSVKPGQRLCRILSRRPLFTDHGLNSYGRNIASEIESRFTV